LKTKTMKQANNKLSAACYKRSINLMDAAESGDLSEKGQSKK